MTIAANQLHLTQGAISQQIKRLEESLESTLFARDGRRLELAEMGERFLGKARSLLKLNDEVCADMTTRPLYGTLRVGVPHDLVGTCFPTIFKAFAETHPYVDVSLVCGSSPELTETVARGLLDIAVVEQPADSASGECLRIEPLVWVAARGGSAHLKRPLPISMVAETCAFRQVVLAALDQEKIEWRTVFESGNIEATTATVRSDLAVTAWLASTVPADLDIVSSPRELPALPPFAISLQLPPTTSQAANEFARHVRDALLRR
jgi:DNA-binding transcriptional LysR family regulator